MQHYKINPNQNVAFIMSPRLGDAIIAMVIVYNLQRQGIKVVVYSKFLYELKRWLPQADIKNYPDETTAQAEWQNYDYLLHTYRHDILYNADNWHQQVVALSDYPLYNTTINMVDLQLLVCKEVFHINKPQRDNGLRIPKSCKFRLYKKRIAIHPTASMRTRYWPGKRFVQLSFKLKHENFDSFFITTENEKQATTWIEENKLQRKCLATLDQVAEFIAESGWFIGSDSGLGHLASAIGIPTVSLHQRNKVRKRWHPAFAINEALLPAINLIYKPWKEKYWKYFLSSEQIIRALHRLQKKYNNQ